MGTRDISALDMTPVREEKNDILTIPEAKERQIVSSLPRQELEDRYLRLREESVELKKMTNKQEAKMKQMATKLLRLVKDRKRLEEGAGGMGNIDLDSKDKIEELKNTVSFLGKQNEQLKNRLQVAKQQLHTHGKKPSAYDHVKSRVFSGQQISSKKPSSVMTKQQRIKEQIRVTGPPPSQHAKEMHKTPHPILPQPRYGHSLLEETRLEKREMEDLVESLQLQLVEYEEKVQTLQSQLAGREINYEEDIQRLRQKVSGTQRNNIQENVEIIKLQREVRDKVSKLQQLQGKYQNLEDLLKKVKTSHEHVLEEMEKLTSKLKKEQLKNSSLTNELKQGNISQQSLALKEEQINDLREEVEMLKEAHGKLLHSTFDAEREREFRAKEKQYQLRIAQLEATIKSDVSEKNVVLDKLTFERDTSDNSQKHFRELQVKYFALKEKHDDLVEKLKFFSGESAADFEEIQDALLLIKTRKERESHDLNFLEKVDEEASRELQKEVQQLQAEHADTINELEKTRSMLIIQHNINKDYQKEVEVTTRRMEELKMECDTRVEEYAQLLDIRAERIKKLERQLKDVAYGTKQYKIKEDDLENLDDSHDATVELERGQNIFEIHIGQIHITKDGLQEFNGVEPITFISYEFFEHELQATPVSPGVRPDFNHTSSFTVQVDDFFLHYLQKETMMLEFHQAVGTEYKTLARGKIRFNELLDKSHGRLHGKMYLLGVEDDNEIVSVEYWIRLRVPMEQALRLYKERTKALGYITSNDLQKLEHPNSKTLKDSGINELKVVLVQCLKLISSRKDVQPSPYCVYKFFDFADHDTDIVASSTSPQYHDYRVFPVPMTEELDNYLKNSNLEVYVFDDSDPEPTNYIGKASIPLITLSQDKPLAGRFQLTNRSEDSTGVLEVTIGWEYTYLPASAKKVRTYPKPINTVVDHDDEVFTQQQRQRRSNNKNNSTMQPMVSAGKLFEPKLKENREGIDGGVGANDVLEPTYERQRDGPRITINTDDDEDDNNVVPSNHHDHHDKLNAKNTTGSPSKKKPPLSVKGGRKAKLSSSNLETDDDIGDVDSDEAFLAEELQRTADAPIVESPVPHLKDTMFEETDDTEEEEDDIVIPKSPRDPQQQQQSGSQLSVADSNATDDDIVVTASRPKSVQRNNTSASGSPCTITVIISSLTLNEDAPVLEVDRIKQLFVSYKFLDCDPEELETPISLPKPKPNRPISFNFKKVFHVDEEEHETSRQFLLHLLMPDHPNEGRIFFTVVSEPMDEEGGADCEDVGIAYVELLQLMANGQDLVDVDIDVLDLTRENEEGEGKIMGSLTVTVQALEAIQSLYE